MAEDGEVKTIKISQSTDLGFWQIFGMGLLISAFYTGIGAAIVGIGMTLWGRFRWKGLIPFLLVMGFYAYHGILISSMAILLFCSIPFWFVRILTVMFIPNQKIWPW